MNEVVLSYTAGIIDGEGSICLSAVPEKSNTRGKKHRLTVAVGNTDKHLVVWLKDTFGGCSILQSRTNNHKDYYQWRITGKKAYHFLRLVHPYLKLKQKRARLGMEFQQPRYRGRRLTDDIWAIEENQKALMQSLNARGVE